MCPFTERFLSNTFQRVLLFATFSSANSTISFVNFLATNDVSALASDTTSWIICWIIVIASTFELQTMKQVRTKLICTCNSKFAFGFNIFSNKKTKLQRRLLPYIQLCCAIYWKHLDDPEWFGVIFGTALLDTQGQNMVCVLGNFNCVLVRSFIFLCVAYSAFFNWALTQIRALSVALCYITTILSKCNKISVLKIVLNPWFLFTYFTQLTLFLKFSYNFSLDNFPQGAPPFCCLLVSGQSSRSTYHRFTVS